MALTALIFSPTVLASSMIFFVCSVISSPPFLGQQIVDLLLLWMYTHPQQSVDQLLFSHCRERGIVLCNRYECFTCLANRANGFQYICHHRVMTVKAVEFLQRYHSPF